LAATTYSRAEIRPSPSVSAARKADLPFGHVGGRGGEREAEEGGYTPSNPDRQTPRVERVAKENSWQFEHRSGDVDL
jgi:hypothetical protein